MARKRGVRSSIESLDKELVDTVNQLIRDGYSIRQLVDKLSELGVSISKSAMGRYTKRVTDELQKYKEAQASARVWVESYAKEPDGDVGRLLVEMLRTIAFNTLGHLGEQDKPIKAADLNFLASAIKQMSATTKSDIDIALLRKRIQAEAKAAADKVTSTVKKAGLSDDTVQAIRTRILGIGDN